MTNVIKEYIEQQPEKIQPILFKVQASLKEALPTAEEKISWRMPTYFEQHNIIHFAAHKNHLGIYPGDQAIVHFKEDLIAYHTSKGAIQFPYDQEIPLKLIQKIAKWCYETSNHH